MGVTVTLPYNLQNGTLEDATQVMANFNALVAGLGNAAAAGTNTDITSLSALTSPIPLVAGRTPLYINTAGSTGSANAQVFATLVPTGLALAAGVMVLVTPSFTNTGALQFNINGTGLKNVFVQTLAGVQACAGGEVVNGVPALLEYDGTQWQLLNPANVNGAHIQQAITASTATLNVDMSKGWNVALTLSATVTTFTVSNWPPAGTLGRLTLDIASTGAFNITGWPATTIWAGGVAPTISSGNGKKDTVVITGSGGSAFRGFTAAQNMS